jgi:hypothetical protein
VRIDGKPLTCGFVQFVPADARSSSARLDEDGHFILNCFEDGDGAVIGEHQVAVIAAEQLSPNKKLWHAPKKYVDYRTSGLKKEIAGPMEDLTIDISWDGGRPFVEDVDTGERTPYLSRR